MLKHAEEGALLQVRLQPAHQFWRFRRCIAAEGIDLAVRQDQVFVEIPQGRLVGNFNQLLVQGISFRAYNGAFFSQRELHAIVALAEIPDFLVAVGFLMKIIGGKTNHQQAFLMILIVDGDQLFELGRETALAGGIDHKDRALPVVAQIELGTLKCGEPEIMNPCTGGVRGIHAKKHQKYKQQLPHPQSLNANYYCDDFLTP